jgi:hypothetical protein
LVTLTARPIPVRHWRSYGTDPLPTGREAMDEPFRAFPSWFLRIECDRCGKERMLNEVHAPGASARHAAAPSASHCAAVLPNLNCRLRTALRHFGRNLPRIFRQQLPPCFAYIRLPSPAHTFMVIEKLLDSEHKQGEKQCSRSSS